MAPREQPAAFLTLKCIGVRADTVIRAPGPFSHQCCFLWEPEARHGNSSGYEPTP